MDPYAGSVKNKTKKQTVTLPFVAVAVFDEISFANKRICYKRNYNADVNFA